MFSLMPDTMANDGFVEFQQQRVNEKFESLWAQEN